MEKIKLVAMRESIFDKDKGRQEIKRNKANTKKFRQIMALVKAFATFSALIGFCLIAITLATQYEPKQASASNIKEKHQISYARLEVKGMQKPPFKLYSKLKDNCFALADDKEHCIKTGLSIAFAESSWKESKSQFGLQSKKKDVKTWVQKYTKYWFKAQEWGHFYGYWPWVVAPSHYCMSEKSSGKKGYCPNGRKSFNKVFFNIKF